MGRIGNKIQNPGFERGELSPWQGNNAFLIENPPCPTMDGQFAAVLKGCKVDASIEQFVNVVAGENYTFSIALATNGLGVSPPVKITLQYLDSSLEFIANGLDITINKGQLPNGIKNNFKVINKSTTRVPTDTVFAKLIIEKMACYDSTGVVIDNVMINAVEPNLTEDVPETWVANSGESTVSVVFPDQSESKIDVDGQPGAIILLTISGEERIYVGTTEKVEVFRVSDMERISSIDISGSVEALLNINIIASSDSSRVYVSATGTSVGFVNIIDTAENTSRSIEIEDIPEPGALDISSDNATLYVGSQTNNNLVIIDLTNDQTDTIDAGILTSRLALTPDDSQLAIGTTTRTGSFRVLDLSSGQFKNVAFPLPPEIIKIILWGYGVYSMGISLSQEYLYIGAELDGIFGIEPIGAERVISGANFFVYSIPDFELVSDVSIKRAFNTSTSNLLPNTFVEIEVDDSTSTIYVGCQRGSNEILGRIVQIQRHNNDEFTFITDTFNDDTTGFVAFSEVTDWIVTTDNVDNVALYIRQSSSVPDFEFVFVGEDPTVVQVIE